MKFYVNKLWLKAPTKIALSQMDQKFIILKGIEMWIKFFMGKRFLAVFRHAILETNFSIKNLPFQVKFNRFH